MLRCLIREAEATAPLVVLNWLGEAVKTEMKVKLHGKIRDQGYDVTVLVLRICRNRQVRKRKTRSAVKETDDKGDRYMSCSTHQHPGIIE